MKRSPEFCNMMAQSLAAANCASGCAYLFPIQQATIIDLINSRSTHLNSRLSLFAASFVAVSLAEARSQSSNTSVQSSADVAIKKPIPA